MGQNVLRSSLHLQHVAARCTRRPKAILCSKMYSRDTDDWAYKPPGMGRSYTCMYIRPRSGTKRGKRTYADLAPTAGLAAAATPKGDRKVTSLEPPSGVQQTQEDERQPSGCSCGSAATKPPGIAWASSHEQSPVSEQFLGFRNEAILLLARRRRASPAE